MNQTFAHFAQRASLEQKVCKKKVLGSSSLLGFMASVAERRNGWAAQLPLGDSNR